MKPVEAVRAVSPTETPQPSDMKGVAPMPVETVTLPTAPVGPDPNLPPAIERAEIKPDPSKDAPPTAEVQPMNTPEPVPRPEVPPTEKPQVEIPTTPNLKPPSPQTPQSPPTPQTPQNPNSGANGATSPVVSPVTGPPGAPGKGTATGDKSDRESDATSIVDVPPSMWRSGKPLARKGLEIKTKKPELPILTRLTTSPGNPVCEVLFGKDGVPVSCKILQSSGFADIDGPVTDALYRWRAKGSQLEKLAPGKTVTFRIRFILN
jgi:outer membrane biosynthesis protein TonB